MHSSSMLVGVEEEGLELRFSEKERGGISFEAPPPRVLSISFLIFVTTPSNSS